ncbi:MAG TPA: Na+/H+ antiporter subunit E [Longimicrobiales bacterium]|nr:Na+/H+ antiporter subunit E [Longimicrobiales bacterium]
MSRFVPQPVISATLLLTWLLLHNAISVGLLLTGVLLAVGLPLLTQRFWPEYPRTIRIGPLLRLIAVVIYDIVVANMRMVVLILGPARRLRPQFVVVPVTLREPFAITLLASIISLTPGTVSANLSGDRRSLLVHDLDVEDPETAVARIRERYEKPLMEVFE